MLSRVRRLSVWRCPHLLPNSLLHGSGSYRSISPVRPLRSRSVRRMDRQTPDRYIDPTMWTASMVICTVNFTVLMSMSLISTHFDANRRFGVSRHRETVTYYCYWYHCDYYKQFCPNGLLGNAIVFLLQVVFCWLTLTDSSERFPTLLSMPVFTFSRLVFVGQGVCPGHCNTLSPSRVKFCVQGWDIWNPPPPTKNWTKQISFQKSFEMQVAVHKT